MTGRAQQSSIDFGMFAARIETLSLLLFCFVSLISVDANASPRSCATTNPHTVHFHPVHPSHVSTAVMQFSDDLLGTARQTAAQGPAIGPIGPPRGPAAPTPAPRNASRSTSPMRRPAVGPSPPRSCTTTGAKKGPAREGGASSASAPRARAGPIGPSRGPEPAPRPTAPTAAASDEAGAAVRPRPRPAGGAGVPEGGASRKAVEMQGKGEAEEAEVASIAASAANGSDSKSPSPAEASVSASIGPAVGPPSRPDVPVAEGDAWTGGGVVDGAQGAAVAESGRKGGGDSSTASVGGKRPREGETATDLADTVVQKPRVSVAADGGDSAP